MNIVNQRLFLGLNYESNPDLCISCQSFTNVGPWSIYSRLLKILQCFKEHELLIFYVKKKCLSFSLGGRNSFHSC